MKLSPKTSSRDWEIKRRQIFDERLVNHGVKDAVELLRERISSRFIEPIERILASDSMSGEGVAAMTLMCVLLEFVQAMRSGKIYRPPLSEKNMRKRAENLRIHFERYVGHRQPTEYRNSKDLFIQFLRQDPYFAEWFDADLADSFYTGIRCGLIHEAATKEGWLIRKSDPRAPHKVAGSLKDGSRIIYRTPFFESLKRSISSYFEDVLEGRMKSGAILRMCDHLTGVRRVFYFAYGSNMSSLQMRSRGIFFHDAAIGVLEGFTFAYDKISAKGCTRANIIHAGSADCVKGVVYEIDEIGLEQLAQYEVGYQKIPVWISSPHGNVEAFAFISEERGRGTPPVLYVETVVSGARSWGIDEEYIEGELLLPS
jgi:hypothetical protein